MKKSKGILLSTALAVGAVGIVGASGVFAAETIGTVTCKDGDVKDKVAITAEVTGVEGSQVTFKDVDTEDEYKAGFGPSRHTKSYEVGDNVEVVGVGTVENNDKGHNFQVMEADGTTLREAFEGKPVWAGAQEGKGNGGSGNGMRKGSGNGGANFVDADGDGVCDDLQ